MIQKLKQNNEIVLSCTISQDLSGATVTAASKDSSHVIHHCPVTIIDQRNFNILMDTTGYPTGRLLFDIKIGTISSDTVEFLIIESIS